LAYTAAERFKMSAELVKAYARRAGLKAANFSGHSLRSVS
jgi:hypothetical protein